MSNIIILAAIILYLGMVVWIGVICSKKNSDVGDFYLGGRKLGPVVTAMSAEASDMSSYLLMGVPGLAYLTGLADATWTAIGLALGTYLNWLIVAKKIRLYSHGYQAITLPDYFSKRFGDDKHVITLISAALIVIFFIPYTASGFAACGKLFNSLLGFNYHTAMIVSAVVIVLYCTMGGFLAASTSDLVQSIIMTFALAVVVILELCRLVEWELYLIMPRHFQDILICSTHILQKLTVQETMDSLRLFQHLHGDSDTSVCHISF